MAEPHNKPRRGLFGIGASAEPAATAVAPSRRGAAQDSEAEAVLRLNLRALAGAVALGAPPPPPAPELQAIGLLSRPVVYADAISPWFAYWVGQLRCSVRPHRKLWDYSIILQTLYESGVLTPGAKLLGFGVGDEPIPSYLAGLGLEVVATDLPDAAERERVLNPAFIAGEAFDARVEVSNLDMRRLDDPTLRGFDACWSCSVLNEMSSMDEAADTVIGAMDVLKPGGVAVHVTDFAFAEESAFTPRGALAFARTFFERLADGLNGRGYSVSPLSFDLGTHPLDGYVDVEPFEIDGAEAWSALWREGLGAPHLKVLQGGVLKTSFVLVVRARP